MNKEDDEASPSEYLFEEERVTIGRAEANDVTLADPKRVVSSEHAMVVCEGTTYQLIDRGSKNFTYVGNQRVTAQEPYKLTDGDTFRIGDFRLTFSVLETDPRGAKRGGETVFDHDFTNPFEEPIQELREALTAIVAAYDQEPAQRRDDALADALRGAPDGVGDHDAVRQVIDTLGCSEHVSPSSTTPDMGASGHPPPSTIRSGKSPSTSSRDDTEERASERPVRAPNPVADSVIDTLSEALAEVAPIPWRFRHEFIGQTIMQAPETQFLYEGDGQAIRDHLMDPTISEADREARLQIVMEAAESVGVHQVAMLNGYKASVAKGAGELLEMLDPGAHERDAKDQNVLFEYVPFFASRAALERVREAWSELHRGDSSVAEQRLFRPAFTKAYLARMTAPHRPDDGSKPASETPGGNA